MMTLENILEKLDELDDTDVVFSEKPWRLNGPAMVGQLDSDYKVPSSVLTAGMDYFLDVSTAREVLEVFGERPPTKKESCELLMYYAENDAFPDWVYQR